MIPIVETFGISKQPAKKQISNMWSTTAGEQTELCCTPLVVAWHDREHETIKHANYSTTVQYCTCTVVFAVPTVVYCRVLFAAGL